MTSGADELSGAGAPPMANGELLFDAPWQSRTFGMARVLCEAGVYTWDEFRVRLIANIARWEDLGNDEPYAYYDHFLETLTQLLAERQLCPTLELGDLEAKLAARPHGHDHA